MKYYLLLAVSLVVLSCDTTNEPLKGPEHLQYRLNEAVLVSRLKGIDSADVNVQYIKKTQYLFKKTNLNKLWLTLHIQPDITINDEFVEKWVKAGKLTLEGEVLNYFAYDGLTIFFYQNGKKIRTYEESFNK